MSEAELKASDLIQDERIIQSTHPNQAKGQNQLPKGQLKKPLFTFYRFLIGFILLCIVVMTIFKVHTSLDQNGTSKINQTYKQIIQEKECVDSEEKNLKELKNDPFFLSKQKIDQSNLQVSSLDNEGKFGAALQKISP